MAPERNGGSGQLPAVPFPGRAQPPAERTGDGAVGLFGRAGGLTFGLGGLQPVASRPPVEATQAGKRRLDSKGRLVHEALLASLGWLPGTQLSVTFGEMWTVLRPGLSMRPPAARIDARGRLWLSRGVRFWLGGGEELSALQLQPKPEAEELG